MCNTNRKFCCRCSIWEWRKEKMSINILMVMWKWDEWKLFVYSFRTPHVYFFWYEISLRICGLTIITGSFGMFAVKFFFSYDDWIFLFWNLMIISYWVCVMLNRLLGCLCLLLWWYQQHDQEYRVSMEVIDWRQKNGFICWLSIKIE